MRPDIKTNDVEVPFKVFVGSYNRLRNRIPQEYKEVSEKLNIILIS